jgi:hypothetical protein
VNGLEKQRAVLSLLRAEFQRERGSDFALLRQIPSTQVRKFLDYFSSLSIEEANALAEALAESALVTFFPYEAKPPYQSGNFALRRYIDALPMVWDWKYEDVRSLRMRLAAANADPKSSFGILMTADLRKWIEGIKPSKSTEIRKVVKLALSQAIPPVTVTHNGGLWRYEGILRGKAITVNIDYHQKNAQFDYGISHKYQSTEPGILRLDANYEQLMGLANHGWNCLEQANLDQSIALLKELIIRCHEFLQKLPD